MRYRAVGLLQRMREDLVRERSALRAVAASTGPAATHDRHATNRLEVAVAELDAVLRHLRRAIEAPGTERRWVALARAGDALEENAEKAQAVAATWESIARCFKGQSRGWEQIARAATACPRAQNDNAAQMRMN
jgi:hypothetical protein